MNKKQTSAIAIILVTGIIFAWLILSKDSPQPTTEEGQGHSEASSCLLYTSRCV